MLDLNELEKMIIKTAREEMAKIDLKTVKAEYEEKHKEEIEKHKKEMEYLNVVNGVFEGAIKPI